MNTTFEPSVSELDAQFAIMWAKTPSAIRTVVLTIKTGSEVDDAMLSMNAQVDSAAPDVVAYIANFVASSSGDGDLPTEWAYKKLVSLT